MRKLNKPGVVVCVYCDCRLDYSKKGKSFIKRHALSVAHTSKRNSIISTQALPAIFKATASLERGDSSTSVNSNPLPYGAAENVVDSHCLFTASLFFCIF